MSNKPFIYFKDDIAGVSKLFDNPIEILVAHTKSQFFDALERIEKARLNELWAAGFISYEAGYLFEEKLSKKFQQKRKASNFPLLCFGIFNEPNQEAPFLQSISKKYKASHFSNFKAEWDFETYSQKFNKLHQHISKGDCYQGNLTFPVYAEFKGNPLEAFQQLAVKQPVKYSAFVNLEKHTILSRSPELFFKIDKEGVISAHPMKGTASRNSNQRLDELAIENLQSDQKSKSENIMIVDLLRNDISRIAKVGSVTVPKIFEVETYPTVHQMISRVEAKVKSKISVHEIFKALFPCGSITGAPKISCMEILDELEESPRDMYCGSIGYISPRKEMLFNVAIRTITLNNNRAKLNVGGGIVWASKAKAEYDEAMLKAMYATQGKFIRPANFNLIETFRWSNKKGFIRLARHLSRLENSASTLGFKLNIDELKVELSKVKTTVNDQRVRVALSPKGEISIQCQPFESSNDIIRLAIAKTKLSSGNFVLQHKTSKREIYEQARREFPEDEIDEVLLENEKGELCEGTFTNIFIRKKIGGPLLTPPLKCGLLAGILRQELLAQGKAKEMVLYRVDLVEAVEIMVGNSLRGLVSASVQQEVFS